VEQYLAELPKTVAPPSPLSPKVILENLDPDFEEIMQYGMIGYSVPHRLFPAVVSL